MSAELDPDRIRKALARFNDVSDPYPVPCSDWESCVQTALAALTFTRKVQLASQYCGQPDDRFGRVVKLILQQDCVMRHVDVPREVALELRLWQSDLNMPAGYRKRLMVLVERLCPELAQENEQFKQSGGVL